VSEAVIVDVSRERLDELEPLWRSLYEHHNEVTPHLRDRARPFEKAWESRRRAERTWLEREPETFVLGAQQETRLVGYAFVRIRSGAGFAESWNISDPLADLVTLAVLPECRGQGIGSRLMNAVEARVRALGVADLAIVVVATNAAVVPFYQRRGALPFITQFVQSVQPEP
jgi:ribosomal protein S18 acetylase RimI-like enzyme